METLTPVDAAGTDLSQALHEHVADHVNSSGSQDASAILGMRQMPEGYALMLNPDQTHFYWLRHDGEESAIHWDRWATYRGAVADAQFEEEVTAVLATYGWRLKDRGDGVKGHFCIARKHPEYHDGVVEYWDQKHDRWGAFGTLFFGQRRAKEVVLQLAGNPAATG